MSASISYLRLFAFRGFFSLLLMLGGESSVLAAAPGDFDGDGRSDFTVVRVETNLGMNAKYADEMTWLTYTSGTGAFFSKTLLSDVYSVGSYLDRSHSADLDGDGATDYSYTVVASGQALHHSRPSAYPTMSYLQALVCSGARLAVFADFDGDKKQDLAVYQSGDETDSLQAEWLIKLSSSMTATSYEFGFSGDLPVTADFDGDGSAELAVYREGEGNWYISNLAGDFTMTVQWGLSGDHPMPGDYDGDGKADLAVWRPSNGVWYILRSASGFDASEAVAIQFGLAGDYPLTGDWDGDGKLDPAVYRREEGTYYILRSSDGGMTVQQWGFDTDYPVGMGIKHREELFYDPGV